MTVIGNLTDNMDKVHYTTVFNTDKVVKTFTGSFRYSTDTITRNYTFAGSPSTQQAYRFAHTFTRPVFVELFWSLDNTTFWIGGGTYDNNNEYTIAYSDSTYIYIMPTPMANGTVVYYKVICSWIDDFDTTDPSVDAFAEIPAAFTQVFNSRSRVPSIVAQGVQSVSTADALLTNVTTNTAHGLSYIPNMKVFIESFSGEVWPLNYGGSSNPYLVDDSQLEAQVFADSTNFSSVVSTKAANGTRNVWYLLYGKQVVTNTTAAGFQQF